MSATSFGRELPRLLRGVVDNRPLDLAEHRVLHGALPEIAFDGSHRGWLEQELDVAGLSGRGGAAFPAAIKLSSVSGDGQRPVVLVNATEGEPASIKDRVLLETAPHLVLDGAEAAARALGTGDVIIALKESERALARAVRRSLSERHDHVTWAARLEIVPDRYVTGQESALINHLNGRPALPAYAPPLPSHSGVGGRPTLVSNVETFAHLGLIAIKGGEWFRQVGTPAHPGSALVTLSGDGVGPAQVLEIDPAMGIVELLAHAGVTAGAAQAVLVGGYFGAWIAGGELGPLRLGDDSLATVGASLGCGVVAVIGQDSCGVAETARIARWFSDESAGQCGPCFNGLDAIAGALERIAAGSAEAGEIARVERWAELVEGRGACAHPDGAARFVGSALRVFEPQFAHHARHGRCRACNRTVLPARPLEGAL